MQILMNVLRTNTPAIGTQNVRTTLEVMTASATQVILETGKCAEVQETRYIVIINSLIDANIIIFRTE